MAPVAADSIRQQFGTQILSLLGAPEKKNPAARGVCACGVSYFDGLDRFFDRREKHNEALSWFRAFSHRCAMPIARSAPAVVSAIDIVRAKRSIFSSSHRDIGPPPARKCCKLFSANRRSRCEHRFYRTTVQMLIFGQPDVSVN